MMKISNSLFFPFVSFYKLSPFAPIGPVAHFSEILPPPQKKTAISSCSHGGGAKASFS
jgi:hypothetical protein